jgi:hypothetical protein
LADRPRAYAGRRKARTRWIAAQVGAGAVGDRDRFPFLVVDCDETAHRLPVAHDD